ncbi:MAG: hypothetical protein AB7S41_06460 [Parvibaculaceae bacterium]
MSRRSICRAIETRTVLLVTYHGEKREVEPHIFGQSSAGNPLLSGWQRSGEAPGWRNFVVSEIEALERTVIRFKRPRDGYNPDDPSFGSIACRLVSGRRRKRSGAGS